MSYIKSLFDNLPSGRWKILSSIDSSRIMQGSREEGESTSTKKQSAVFFWYGYPCPSGFQSQYLLDAKRLTCMQDIDKMPALQLFHSTENRHIIRLQSKSQFLQLRILIQLQYSHKCFLGNINRTYRLHPLLTFGLLL